MINNNTGRRLRKAVALLCTSAMLLGLWTGGAIVIKAAPTPITGNEWNTPETVRVNQLEARAMIIPFDDIASAKANPTLRLAELNSPNVTLLNGTWKFKWARTPSSRPNINGVTSIPDDYIDITVPSSWQVNGMYAGWTGATSSNDFDWPIYNNQDYPWQATGDGVSSFSGTGNAVPSTTFNPVGTYMRTLDIGTKDPNTRYIITFLGVESGFYLYVNGQVIGYDEDSFGSSEFDITDYLTSGENLIGAQVFRWTTGSWIENQDMIDWGGIARDVYLTEQPLVSIFDYNVDATFSNHNYTSGAFSLNVDVINSSTANASGYSINAYLYDPDGNIVSSVAGLTQSVSPAALNKATAAFSATIDNPRMWSAEFPNLYTLVMELKNGSATVQTVGKRVGFREFYVEGKSGTTFSSTANMRINGQNIEFYGVNRHENTPDYGRHVPYNVIVKDVTLLKQLNANSVRTSHYPPDPHFIEVCDEYGIYVMDEVGVESHNGRTLGGTHDSNLIGPAGDRDFPGNDRRYTNAMVDRMTSMVMRDKNNASVIIYSLGNEAGEDGGASNGNFNAMIDVIKALDGEERLIHYQGWNGNSRVDMTGSMYPSFTAGIQSTNNRPYIAMEYGHMMGNTGGGMEMFTSNFESNLRHQGGFLWEYIDHSAYTIQLGANTSDGVTKDELFLGFDSDWKQYSADVNFCGDGFIGADRSWKPAADEVKQAYQDLKFTQTAVQAGTKQISIRNVNRFKNANYYDIVWSILENGKVIETGTLDVDLAPNGNVVNGANTTVSVPYTTPAAKQGAEYFLTIDYRLKSDEVWEKKGYVLGSKQFEVASTDTSDGIILDPEEFSDMETVNGATEVKITGTTQEDKPFSVTFDKTTGLMTSFNADGNDLITKAPVGSFFRPETDQNAASVTYSRAVETYNNWYNQGENAVVNSFSVTAGDKLTKIKVLSTLSNGSGYETSYEVYANGTINVTATLAPSASSPAQLGEVGMLLKTPAEFDNMTWYGRGPGETYWDRKGSNTIGVWNTSVASLDSPYMRLQEYGNRTDVRWLALTNDDGVGLLTSMTYGAGYSGHSLEAVALRYMPGELSLAQTGGWANINSTTNPPNKHQYQAKVDSDIVLRVLLHQKGVANYDWSNDPPEAVIYKTNSELMTYSYTLRPLFKESDPMTLSKQIMGEPEKQPTVSTIKVNGKNVNGFASDIYEYNVELASGETLPVLSATGPSIIEISYTQPTSIPGVGKVHVTYDGTTVDYIINFSIAQPVSSAYLSDIAFFPGVTATTKFYGMNTAGAGKTLFAYSGYASIYNNQNQNGRSLEIRASSGTTVYPKGFGGNATQIIDIDISDYEATTFAGVGGIDYQMKPNHATSSIIFEVWGHKDVSQLTQSYYSNTSNMNPAANYCHGSSATAHYTPWQTAGWTRLDNSGTTVVRGSTTPYSYNFNGTSLTYAENGETKSYQAIRLVMNANASNGHDQGVWGNTILNFAPQGGASDIGIGDPDPEFRGIKINGISVAGFSKNKYEYDYVVNYGATKIPVVTADYDSALYVKMTQADSLPGKAIVTVDDGIPVTYTINFVKAAGFTGESAYVGDLVTFPTLTTNTSASAGNLLYAYSGYNNIYIDKGATGGSTISLRESGTGDDAVIVDYTKSIAGNAQQIIDIDISSVNALRFTSDAGVDWATRPDSGGTNANGPLVKFQIFAYKNIAELDGTYYSKMSPTATSTGTFTDGWIMLDESPNMSSGCYTGSVTRQNDLYKFDVDLTYVENGERKSYEAIRLVMDSANSSASRDEGIWGAPVITFAEEADTALSFVAVKAEIDETGAEGSYLINFDTSSGSKDYNKLLAIYNSKGQMIGFETQTENTSIGNDDSSINFEADEYFIDADSVAMYLWDAATQAPLAAGATNVKGGEIVRSSLPAFYGRASEPSITLEPDTDDNTVTVIGSGFAAYSLVTLSATADGEIDYIGQGLVDGNGNFEITYMSAYCINTECLIKVSVGGQGLDKMITESVKTEDVIRSVHSFGLYSDGYSTDVIPASGDVSVAVAQCFDNAIILTAVYNANGKLLSISSKSSDDIKKTALPYSLPILLPDDRAGIEIAAFVWDAGTYVALASSARW